MQFTCASCQKTLKIPDTSVPKADKFAIPCPFCKQKNIIDKSDPANPVAMLADAPPPPPPIEDDPAMDLPPAGGSSIFEDDLPPPLDDGPPPPIADDGPVGGGLESAFGPIGDEPPVSGFGAPQPPQAPPAAPAAPAAPTAAPKPAPTPPRPVQQSAQAATGLEPEIFPPGARVAFVAVQNAAWAGPLKSFFSQQGFHVSEAQDASVGLAKLRLNSYHVVVLEEGETGDALLAEISGWSGVKRRDALLLYIGSQGDSLDPRPGFSMSVNSYLNASDASRASQLLPDALAEYDAYYELWRSAEAAQAQEE